MKPARVTIRPLEAGDIPEIAAAFQRIGWDKPASQYERYLRELAEGAREVSAVNGLVLYFTKTLDSG